MRRRLDAELSDVEDGSPAAKDGGQGDGDGTEGAPDEARSDVAVARGRFRIA